MRIWPNSPAKPRLPSTTRPPTTTAPPTPVPSVKRTRSSIPLAVPNRISPNAAAWASLMTRTGRPKSFVSQSPRGTSTHPSRLEAVRTRPFLESRIPGVPTPTEPIRSGRRPEAWINCKTTRESSATAGRAGPLGVATSFRARTSPSGVTTPILTEVPPRSIPTPANSMSLTPYECIVCDGKIRLSVVFPKRKKRNRGKFSQPLADIFSGRIGDPLTNPKNGSIFSSIARGCGAVGSASEWHSEGQGFKSPQLHF